MQKLNAAQWLASLMVLFSAGAAWSLDPDLHEDGRLPFGRLFVIDPDGTNREFEINTPLSDEINVLLQSDVPIRRENLQFHSKQLIGNPGQQRARLDFHQEQLASRPTRPLESVKTSESLPTSGGGTEATAAEDKRIEVTEKQIDGDEESKKAQERLMIGVHCDVADELLRGHLKLGEKGLVVLFVRPESPADAAGIRRNDLILTAGDQDLKTVQDLLDVVKAQGEKELTIELLRMGDPLSIQVTPRMMQEPREVVITVSGSGDGERRIVMQDGQRITELPDQLQNLILRQGQLRLRQIPSGIVIDKSVSQDDLRRLIQEATEATRAAAAEAVAETRADEGTGEDVVRDLTKQIQDLQRQLQEVSERLSKLEKPK